MPAGLSVDAGGSESRLYVDGLGDLIVEAGSLETQRRCAIRRLPGEDEWFDLAGSGWNGGSGGW